MTWIKEQSLLDVNPSENRFGADSVSRSKAVAGDRVQPLLSCWLV